MILNSSPTCECGEPKNEKKQWCEPCWQSFSLRDRDCFTERVTALSFIVESLDREARGRKGGQ